MHPILTHLQTWIQQHHPHIHTWGQQHHRPDTLHLTRRAKPHPTDGNTRTPLVNDYTELYIDDNHLKIHTTHIPTLHQEQDQEPYTIPLADPNLLTKLNTIIKQRHPPT